MTQSPHSGQSRLRPRARLLRTLGTDLISSEKVALIELVKNSFDADATLVIVRFCGPLTAGSGTVEVWDDGHGMDVDTLQTSWLDIATDVKKKRIRSESGQRRVLGEKGIGRLAAARLAAEMMLTTRRAGADEVRLLIDWSDFDREDAYLDQIDVAWDVGTPSIFADGGPADATFEQGPTPHWHRGQGTLLQLERLTRAWTEEDFRDLSTALSRLVRPRPHSGLGQAVDGFKIVLDLPEEFADLSGEVGPPNELRSPHYQLVGSVDATGAAQLRYTQLDPPVDTPISDERLWTDNTRAPQSGPFELDIEVWDRDRTAIEKVSGPRTVRDFRRLLDQVAGVSVYRDGFRVLPFGEAGDDWLALDRRRVQNPTMRVSNNQVIGHVFIGADTNTELRDQSNREGLLEGPAYEDLRTLVQNALNLIETRRRLARRTDSTPKPPRTGLFSRFELSEIRTALAAKYPTDSRLIGLIDAKNEDLQQGVEEVQRVLAQYSRLATLGSLIDRVLHDGRTAVSRLRNIVRFGERDLTKASTPADRKVEQAVSSLGDTSIQAELLATLFSQIEPFSGRKRGKPKIIPLGKIIDDSVAIFRAEADELGVQITIDGDSTDVRVDPSEILSVLVNLLQNALYWLSTTPPEAPRKIAISMRRNKDESVSILVSDSGPGVPEEFHEIIFDAYFSSRPDGVGLGLSLAGNIVQEFYGGKLKLVDPGPLPGATFEATLRRRV
jgi:signal transduction histidine kinase